MQMTKVACICEGAFERAIIDILLDNDCLIFNRSDLLEEEVLRCRSAKSFQKNYLNKSMEERVLVYRIIDSSSEKFKITGPYNKRIKRVIDVITSPEIEMLVIHAEKRYEDYSKKGIKPSEYVKQYLKMPDVKSYEFVLKYFEDINKLKNAIFQYHSKTQNKEHTIFNLIIKK